MLFRKRDSFALELMFWHLARQL